MARILVVDDDPDITQALRLVLTSAGHSVREERSAEAGWNAAHSWNPDLLVLDVMMEEPDDGLHLARRLRREGFGCPILLLTSLGLQTGLRYDLSEEMAPVDAFHEKPIEPEALLSTVRALLLSGGSHASQ
jgi:DNA-binding response OmpR family regulator